MKLKRILLQLLVFSVVFPCFALAGEESCVEFKTVGDSKYVLWRNLPVLELYKDREVRFRATPDNNHWVGVKNDPQASDGRIALTWDKRNNTDYELKNLTFNASKEGFEIKIEALGPKSQSQITSEITARLISAQEGFEYDLSSTLKSTVSGWRNAHMKTGDKGTRWIEPFNYHLERISRPIRLRSIQKGLKDLYRGFVRSDDGKNWIFIPKMHVPTHPLPKGVYSTQNFRGELPPSNTGCYYGVLDEEEGGWMTQIIETSRPVQFTICWMFFDVHCYMLEAVPAETDDDKLDLHCAVRFTPVKPQKAREILAQAKEVQWRNQPEYELPVFSRYNTFQKLVHTDEYCWNKSDAVECFRDETIGYDDNYSISIKKDRPGVPAVWYGWCWGPAYEVDKPLDGTYRFSAMIKTRDCAGKVRLGISESNGDNWYGRETPGEWNNKKFILTYAPDELTGTNDWTPVSIDLKIDDDKIRKLMGRPVSCMGIFRMVMIELSETGQCWIDNVRIQKLESISD